MSEIKNLQLKIHKINKRKGWHDRPLRKPDGSIDAEATVTKLALIHTELSEAEIERYHGRLSLRFEPDNPSKPEGYVVELADALIRALDTCEALGVVMDPKYAEDLPGDYLLSARTMVDFAIESVRAGSVSAMRDALAALWVDCQWRCYQLELDLDGAILAKIAYNETRPHRHGGKLA